MTERQVRYEGENDLCFDWFFGVVGGRAGPVLELSGRGDAANKGRGSESFGAGSAGIEWQAGPLRHLAGGGAPRELLLRYVPGGVNGVGESDPSQYFFNVLVDFKPEEAPLRPSVAAAARQSAELTGHGGDPKSLCLPTTPVPMAGFYPSPFKIVQSPGLMLVLYEADTSFRRYIWMAASFPVTRSHLGWGTRWAVGKATLW